MFVSGPGTPGDVAPGMMLKMSVKPPEAHIDSPVCVQYIFRQIIRKCVGNHQKVIRDSRTMIVTETKVLKMRTCSCFG